MESDAVFPGLVRIMWLPTWRRNTQPARSKARRASLPETTGSSGNCDLDFCRSHGEGEPLLGSHLEAADDSLADIRERFFLGMPLAHAAWNRWAFGDDHA